MKCFNEQNLYTIDLLHQYLGAFSPKKKHILKFDFLRGISLHISRTFMQFLHNDFYTKYIAFIQKNVEFQKLFDSK